MTYDNTRSSLVSRALSFLLRSDPGTRHPARWVKENNTAHGISEGRGVPCYFLFPNPRCPVSIITSSKGANHGCPTIPQMKGRDVSRPDKLFRHSSFDKEGGGEEIRKKKIDLKYVLRTEY